MNTTMRPAWIGFAAVLLIASAAPAAAQQSETEFTSWRVPGWSLTPGISIGVESDSNVGLMDSGEFGNAQRDSLFNLEPFGSLEFISPRTELSAGYRGLIRRYTEVDGLNGFDQRMNALFRHDATKRLTIFFSDNFSDVPTTDEVDLQGVPFMRTGARTNNFAGGVDGKLTKYTDVSARYELTWVEFDNKNTLLRGGFVNGISSDVKRRMGRRLTLGAEYSMRFANLNEGTRALRFYDGGGVVNFQAGPRTTLMAAGGMSHLSDEAFDQTRTAPYFRLGATHTLEAATLGTSYARTFVPAFGFGGASESQEFIGFVHMPIPANRAYVQGSLAWRHSAGWLSDLELDTVSARSTVGYALARWFRIEGSYSYTRQDSEITGGEVDRHRLRAQVVIAQPMRIQ